MPITEERISKLWEYGLSEYAARAYLALLDLGVAEAREVSKLSRVPTSKIYNVLEHLHEKGLVTVFPEFPKRYAPVAFRDFLTKRMQEHEAAAQSIQENLGRLDRMFTVTGNANVGDQGGFTVLRGRRNVLEKAQEMLAATEQDLLMLGSAGAAHRQGHYRPLLTAMAERGARARYLLPVTGETLPLVEPILELAEVRVRDFEAEGTGGNVAILLSDGARALIVHFVPDDGHLYQGQDVGIYTDQQAVVSALQMLLESYWRRSPDLRTRMAELEAGRVPEFTRFLHTHQDVFEGFSEAMGRGVGEVLVVNMLPMEDPDPAWVDQFNRIREGGAVRRAVLNVEDPEIGDWLLERMSGDPRVRIRHLALPTVSRFLVFDEREALYSIAKPVPAPKAERWRELSIHTSNPHAVRSMRDHFEELWGQAQDLKARVQELREGVKS